MGYGGSRNDAGKAIGKTGDERIDGIIKEDRQFPLSSSLAA
jgi:restriction system protein